MVVYSVSLVKNDSSVCVCVCGTVRVRERQEQGELLLGGTRRVCT